MKKSTLISIISSLTAVSMLFGSAGLFCFDTDEKSSEVSETKVTTSVKDYSELHADIPDVTGADVEGREWYDFSDYSDEIKNDGSEDVSSLLQACVNEHENVYIPAGSYKLSATVNLKSNSGIKGDGENTVFIVEHINVFNACGTWSGSGFPDFIENVLVCNFKVEQTVERDTVGHYALYTKAVRNLTVRNIHTVRAGLVHVATDCYGFIHANNILNENFREYLSSNVIIRDCVADGDLDFNLEFTGELQSGIKLFDISRFLIENVKLHDMQDGVVYWGGPALKDYGGNMNNLGSVCDGRITNCEIYNISAGGIWGCAGVNLLIDHNKVYYCGDTGIDFEGGDMCFIEDNTVYDTYANFMILDCSCGTFVFRNNYSLQTGDLAVPLYCSHIHHLQPYTNHCYFSSDSEDENDIHANLIFDGNTFEGNVMSYIGAGYYGGTRIDRFVFTNNTCKNAVLSTILWRDFAEKINKKDYYETTLIKHIDISDNTFDITEEMHGYFPNAIFIYASKIAEDDSGDTRTVRCVNNKITMNNSSSAPAVSIIRSEQEDAVNILVEGNETNKNGIFISNSSKSNDTVTLRNNVCSEITLEGYKKDFVLENNKDLFGNIISEHDVIQNGNIVAPEKTNKKGIAYSPMLAGTLLFSIDGIGALTWNGAEEYSLDYERNKDYSATFKTLWQNDPSNEKVRLVFNMHIEKSTGRLSNEKMSVKLDFGEISGEVGITIRDSFTKSGSLFETGAVNASAYAYLESAEYCDFLVVVLIQTDNELFGSLFDDAKSGKQPCIAANVTLSKGKTELGGWTASESETDTSKFGKIIFNNYIPQRFSDDVVIGDVNADGKIKGNDATLLLKYLADWNVTIDTACSDCNGDGKIKGNDATLLLKYLADWNVKLG